MFLCFADLVDHIVQYAGANPQAQAILNARSAATAALRVMSTIHQWQYYNSLFIVNTNGPYSTGTLQYTEATRTVTLTGGTWPTWAAYGYLVFNNATYQVTTRVSGTVLTLDSQSTPGEDVAAGTAFNLRRDTYPLPADFGSASSATVQPGVYKMQYVTDATALTGRNYNVGTGRPQYFAVVKDPQATQRLATRVWPAPNQAYHIQYTYRRKLIDPVLMRESPGLASIAASDATVTGAGTTFSSRMAGCAIRLSADAKTLPTGIYGDNPAAAELQIQSVASETSLTATAAADETLASKKYVITSILDVDPESALEYLFREAETQYRMVARVKNTPEEVMMRREAYQRACEADNRFFGKSTVGPVVRAGVFDFVTVIPAN